jgi:hypothetical protein
MKAMDMDHHKALATFETELGSTQDRALKKTVKQGKKVIAQHTKIADKMCTKMGLATYKI